MLRLKYFTYLFLLLIPLWSAGMPFMAQSPDSAIANVLQSIDKDTMAQTIQELQAFQTRFALSPNRKDVAMYIASKFQSYGYTDVRLDSFLLDSLQWPANSGIYYSTMQYNVIAELQGVTDPDKVYIMGAHYDAIINPGDAFTTSPGADDNASGIAAALETARLFKKHAIQPAYTIRFIGFAAEELYLKGSNDYAGKILNNGDDVKLMINNDMIGHNLQPVNNWKLRVQMYPNTWWIVNLTAQLAQDYTTLTTDTATNATPYSDSYPFHLKGYDAVFYQEWDFYNSFHTVSDIMDSIDIDYCTEVTKISCAMLLWENLIAGVSMQTENLSWAVFPNPVTEQLNILLPEGADLDYEVSISTADYKTVLLQTIKEQTGSRGFLSFNIQHFKPGIYYCRIKTKSQISYQKIIKI